MRHFTSSGAPKSLLNIYAWLAKLEGWLAKLEGWLAKLEGWMAKLEGWLAKLVAHLPVKASSLGSKPDIPQKS